MKTPALILFLTLSSNAVAIVPAPEFGSDDKAIEAAISSTLFAKIDRNKDAKVSLDEIYYYRTKRERRRAEARADEAMSKCDTNKDGHISADEVEKISMEEIDFSMVKKSDDCRIPAPILEQMDANGDGSISKEEIIEGASNHRRPPPRFKKRMKKRAKERMKKHQEKQFKRCDKDKNNYLTLREAASMKCNMYTEMFDARDKDGNTLISLDEMMADVKPPRFEEELAMNPMIERERKMPPHVSMQRKMYECDKNENGKLELGETTAKNCNVDLSYFNSADTNGDKSIDHKEMRRSRMKVEFDKMDKNNDGSLDKKEFIGSRIRYM